LRSTRVLLIALLVACGGTKRDDGAAFKPLDIGAAVPPYAALTLAGDTVRVGGSAPPTVLNVWATWCTSCREEMEALDSLKREYEAKGVRVIAVSVDNGDISKVRRFAESNKLEMIVAHDPVSGINQSYEVMGVPTTFIIGRDGKLLWRHTGNITEVMAEARRTIAAAVSQ
jgi:thiol-disulfide isomerase/thioredoxin